MGEQPPTLIEMVNMLLDGGGLETLPPDTTDKNLAERLWIILQAAVDEQEQVDAGAEMVAMNLAGRRRSRDPGRRTDAQVKADLMRRGIDPKYFPNIQPR